ncbi:hypothetical protein [Marinobacter sp. Arc7-DN-1]|uniref:hypothetical protein n=1 Tax=Marinobacter sp. Arc7-DN-1 TaxID=2304594 RepID=UPI000E44943E|nr:hypothetical protein [Marinobacter sp. Arc7-DN-1]AXS84540.1 hypothetical protein D0851_16840 [Marinobacter sp. Arc7-DN-1]
MNFELIKQINEYVTESLLEAEEQEILSCIDSPDYPSSQDISEASQLIQSAIQESKRRRLAERQAAFAAHQASHADSSEGSRRRTASEMVADIAKALQNRDNVPQGLLLAFREQQNNATDEDVARIWRDLVALGLIEPDDTDSDR